MMIEKLGLAEHFKFSLLFVFSPRSFRTMRDWIARLERRLAEDPPDERAYLRQLDFCRDHDASARLFAISAPTLVLTGGHDVLTSPLQGRELAELIPGAEYREHAAASHAVIWEEAETFADLIASFVCTHARVSADP